MIVVAGLWLAGVVVAVPFVLWWAHDFSRIPGRVWFWTGRDRRPWQWAMLLGLVCGGWVAVGTAIRWRLGDDRRELLDELGDRTSRHRAERLS